MRADWIPLSASALVIGAMSLVLGALLNPLDAESSSSETLQLVTENGGRWLGMSVAYFGASVALTLGLPSMLSLFTDRARRVGLLAVVVWAVGVLGTSGYAMLLVFFRAIVKADAIDDRQLDIVTADTGFSFFLYGWIASFYVGVLLLALALFVARRTPVWVPILMVVFVVLFPFVSQIGRVGQMLQVMGLAVAFTGIAIASVNDVHRNTEVREPSY